LMEINDRLMANRKKPNESGINEPRL